MNLKKQIRKKINFNHITNVRFMNIMIVTIVLFLIIIYRLYNVQILNSTSYKKSLDSLTVKTVTSSSVPRGRIFDRNYNLLVDNVGVKTIYYRRVNGTSTKDLIDTAYLLSKNIEVDSSKLEDINLREFYYVNNKEKVDSKITKKEWQLLKERKITNGEIEKLKLERISSDELNSYSSTDREAAYIYFLMNNGYFYDEKIIKTDATDSEYAYVGEHISSLNGVNIKLEWERKYLYGDVFRTILGNVSNSSSGIPKELKDKYLKLGYELNDRVGVTYLEYQYEDELKGKKAVYTLNNDNSYTLLEEGVRGNDIVLTIDINIQKEVESILTEEIVNAKKNDINTIYYDGSRVVVTEPETGEILAMASKQVVNDNGEYKVYDNTPSILTNPVTPGSIVKGASMTVGYKSGAIDIGTKMVDECVKISGAIAKCSWTDHLGVLDDINALAYSSNSYQYKIAIKTLGTNYRYNISLPKGDDSFKLYRTTFKEYGLGEKTNIDLPVESYGTTGVNDNPGTLLDLAIGQYDTYTPIQIAQYISTIAAKGDRYQLHLLKEVRKGSNSDSLGKVQIKNEPKLLGKVNVDSKYIDRIREGFKAVMHATGYGYMGNQVDAAGKTGTSQSFYDVDGDGYIDVETLSKGFIGFAPYDNPKYSIVVLSPNVRYSKDSKYTSPVNLKISSRVSNKVFEILK